MRQRIISTTNPFTMGAKESWSIEVSIKRDLLIDFFGFSEVERLDFEISKGFGNPYLNKMGANVYYNSTGGSTDDPNMNFTISGHHPGEAAKTFEALCKAA